MKKLLFAAGIMAATLGANAQANFWNLNGSTMDCQSPTSAGGTLSSTSYPLYLYQADASSFAMPGLCNTYLKLNYTPAGGRAITYKLDHVTEHVSPSIPGFTSGSYQLSVGTQAYSDLSHIAATKLKADGSRDIYASVNGAIMKIATISPSGIITNSPTLLSVLPGLATWFDRWTNMEVSSDGQYLLLVGHDALTLEVYNITAGTLTSYPAPGGTNSRIQGFEFVNMSTPRLYVSYNNRSASNPSGTGGVAYYTLGNTTSYTSVTTLVGYGFSEIELAKNGLLYLAYAGSSPTYNFSADGVVHTLTTGGTFSTTAYTVPANINVTYAAHCNKYFIQTQIDGENYDAGSYIAPSVIFGSVKLKNVVGQATPSMLFTRTLYRCGSDPLMLQANFANMTKGYTVKVTKGSITASNVFVPAGGPDNVTFTCPSSDPSYYANSINFPLLPSVVPSTWAGSDWKVEITLYGACSASSTSTSYFKVRSVSVLANYYAHRDIIGAVPNNLKPLQTTPLILTAMPSGVNLTKFREALGYAMGWAGASSAGISSVSVDPGATWVLKVYEVDGATGVRRQISGVDVPDACYSSGANSISGNILFKTISRNFDTASSATGYVDIATTYTDGFTYFDEYYMWAKGVSAAELTAFSAKTWCTELAVTHSSCTAVNKSFFRIASTTHTNGDNAKFAVGVEEAYEEETVNVKILPNPTSENVTLMLPYNQSEKTFLLMDNTGRKVMEVSHLNGGKNEINLGDLSNGVYLYELKVSNTIKHGKLIKQ